MADLDMATVNLGKITFESFQTNIEKTLECGGINTLSHVSFLQYVGDVVNNGGNIINTGASDIQMLRKALWDIPADLQSTIANAQEYLTANHTQMLKDLQYLKAGTTHNIGSMEDPSYDCTNISMGTQGFNNINYRLHMTEFQTKWLAEGVTCFYRTTNYRWI